MSLGSQTEVVNGQRYTMPVRGQYNPASYGVQTTGVPQASPVMPPFMNGAGGGSNTAVYEGVNGHGTAGNNNLVTSIAAEHPFSLSVSPVWWWVLALLVGLWLLNAVHWRRTIDESSSGAVDALGARASASERAEV